MLFEPKFSSVLSIVVPVSGLNPVLQGNDGSSPQASCHLSLVFPSFIVSQAPSFRWALNLFQSGKTFLHNFKQTLLPATRRACNPNLQVINTHAWYVCSQHSFGLPLRMNKMHRTQFDHARLDFLSLVIWSRVLTICLDLRKAQRWSESVLASDHCRPHSVAFGYY